LQQQRAKPLEESATNRRTGTKNLLRDPGPKIYLLFVRMRSYGGRLVINVTYLYLVHMTLVHT
jgi:hypothetical protein